MWVDLSKKASEILWMLEEARFEEVGTALNTIFMGERFFPKKEKVVRAFSQALHELLDNNLVELNIREFGKFQICRFSKNNSDYKNYLNFIDSFNWDEGTHSWEWVNQGDKKLCLEIVTTKYGDKLLEEIISMKG